LSFLVDFADFGSASNSISLSFGLFVSLLLLIFLLNGGDYLIAGGILIDLGA
jgi:hypothetical protein